MTKLTSTPSTHRELGIWIVSDLVLPNDRGLRENNGKRAEIRPAQPRVTKHTEINLGYSITKPICS